MKGIQFVLIIFMLYNLSGCNLQDKSQKIVDFKQTEWIVGNWENKTSNGKSIESWQNLNDSTLVGKSMLIKDKDSILLENILIIQRNKELYYIPSVVNQNEGKPIEFKLTQALNNMLIFENPAHDFPQKIVYKKISGDSIVAEVSGISSGKERSIKFPMKKIKNGI